MPAKGSKILIGLIAVITWFALSLQLYILINNVPANNLTIAGAIGRFFLFFTILTNILVAISLTSLLLIPASAAGRFFSSPVTITGIAVYIFIVGVVYNIVLRSVWQPTGFQKLADELFHVAIPLLFIFYWVVFAPKHSLQWVHAFRWLIYPALYLVYALFRGTREGFYPYPFLNAKELSFGRVFMNSVGLLIIFIITGIVFIAVANLLTQTNKSP